MTATFQQPLIYSGDYDMLNNDPELVAGAVRAAKAEKSDPFALHRNISHVRNGVCEDIRTSKGKYLSGGYDAKPKQIKRAYVHPFTRQLKEYDAVEYVDMKRP